MAEQGGAGSDEVGTDVGDPLIGPEELDLENFPSPKLNVGAGRARQGGRSGAWEDLDDQDLYGWMEQFAYQPGVSFVRVFRKHPAKWEGIDIQGFTEDLDEPQDVDYLADRWGGGTYRLNAIQLTPAGDRTKTVDRFTITVAGPPTGYRGPDGEPRDLPQPDIRGSRRRNDEGDEDRTRSSRMSAYDLLMQERLHDRGDRVDTEALEVVRRAQLDANEHYSKAVEQQQKIADQTIRAQREELNLARERMQDADERRNEPIRQATSMIEARANSEASMMRAQLDAMRQEHVVQLGALQTQHQMQLSSVERQHAQMVDALQRELDRAREDSRSRVEQTQMVLAAQYQGQITALEQRLHATEQNSMQQSQLVRSDSQHRETTMQALMTQGFESRVAVIQQERDRLVEDKRMQGAELAQLRALSAERKDPLSSLAEMQGLISAVRDISGDGPGPDAPEDFLGKVAHYGPGLAKNFLGPVLERVDKATDIANRSLSMQQQAIAGPAIAPPPDYQMSQMSQMQPQVYQPAEQEAYAAPAEVPLDDNSPLVQIVDFLDSQLRDGATPGPTAGMLREAVQGGLVPAEAFHAFVSRDTNTITGEVLDSAAARGSVHLNSPNGAAFIQAVLSHVKGGA